MHGVCLRGLVASSVHELAVLHRGRLVLEGASRVTMPYRHIRVVLLQFACCSCGPSASSAVGVSTSWADEIKYQLWVIIELSLGGGDVGHGVGPNMPHKIWRASGRWLVAIFSKRCEL